MAKILKIFQNFSYNFFFIDNYWKWFAPLLSQILAAPLCMPVNVPSKSPSTCVISLILNDNQKCKVIPISSQLFSPGIFGQTSLHLCSVRREIAQVHLLHLLGKLTGMHSRTQMYHQWKNFRPVSARGPGVSGPALPAGRPARYHL